MGGSGVIDVGWKGQWSLSVGMAVTHRRDIWSALHYGEWVTILLKTRNESVLEPTCPLFLFSWEIVNNTCTRFPSLRWEGTVTTYFPFIFARI